MNLKAFSLAGLLVLGTTSAFAGVNVGVHLGIGLPAPIIVRQAPPRRATEVIVATPGPGYVWVAGHYSWREGNWVWVPGAWVTPPQPGTVWVEGRWDAGTNSWTPEHWEYVQTTTPPPVVMGPPPPPPGEVIVQVAPPPPRVEHRVHRPGRDYVWVNGYWAYRRGQYVWMSGHWDRAPRGRRVWVEPRWERRGGNYVFIEGSWR